MADMDQKDPCSCMYKAGIAGYYAPRAVFPSLGLQAPHALHFGRYGPEVQLQWHVQSWFSGVSAPRAVLPEVDRKLGF